MHAEHLERWTHGHHYLPPGQRRNERNTRWVIALTAMMMVVEVAAGSIFNSMALLADGWHMASHASALGITAFAYLYARRRAGNARWSYGLLRDTSRVLLDGDVDPETVEQIREVIEAGSDDVVADLHLWRVGPQGLAAIVSLVSHDAKQPDEYKAP